MTLEAKAAGDPRLLSPLALAFVGDGVYELLVREMLVAGGTMPVRELHRRRLPRCGRRPSPRPTRRSRSCWTRRRWRFCGGEEMPTEPARPAVPTRPITGGPPEWRLCLGTCTCAGGMAASGNCLGKSAAAARRGHREENGQGEE